MKIEVLVDGRKQGRPVELIPGDSIMYTDTGGQLPDVIVGKVDILERQLEQCRQTLRSQSKKIHAMSNALDVIASATTIHEMRSLARDSGGHYERDL